VARRFWLFPGPFLDHRNRCPKEQCNEDAVGEWFHQPLLAYLWSSPGWCVVSGTTELAAQGSKENVQRLRTAIRRTNFRSPFSYPQGLQKPPWPHALVEPLVEVGLFMLQEHCYHRVSRSSSRSRSRSCWRGLGRGRETCCEFPVSTPGCACPAAASPCRRPEVQFRWPLASAVDAASSRRRARSGRSRR